jgi:hypothetical protein
VQGWAQVALDDAGTTDTSVWLNTALLLWIVAAERQKDEITKAADEGHPSFGNSGKRYGAD